MSKKSPPIGLAIIICDTVIADQKTGKKSLIGIFNRIWAQSFPAPHPELHIFISLTNGHGHYKCSLQCLNESNGQIISKAEGDIDFEDPRQVIEADFNLRGLVFPAPGQYSFEFLCNGNPLLHRRFTVDQAKTEEDK